MKSSGQLLLLDRIYVLHLNYMLRVKVLTKYLKTQQRIIYENTDYKCKYVVQNSHSAVCVDGLHKSTSSCKHVHEGTFTHWYFSQREIQKSYYLFAYLNNNHTYILGIWYTSMILHYIRNAPITFSDCYRFCSLFFLY